MRSMISPPTWTPIKTCSPASPRTTRKEHRRSARNVSRFSKGVSAQLELPRLQRVDDLLAFGVLDHRPAGDLVDGALAADAEAGLGVHDADALAGRHHPSRRQRRWRRIGHDSSG